MLIDILKYKIKVNGVLHIGAHNGSEYSIYKKMGIRDEDIIFVEADPENFKKLKSSIKSKYVQLKNFAVADKIGKMIMYCSPNNDGQSNSLLKPKLHLKQHPEIKFTYQKEVEVLTIDTAFNNPPNFLVCDTQGAEGLILKGAKNTLHKFDYIYLEVNRGEVYEGNILVYEIDEILSDFERVETKWVGLWGDAIYVRKNK